ncbi:MAG TPA: serine/threonine-protein kinase, partial [Polyangia bacterium]
MLKRLSRGGMGEIFLAKLGEIQGFEKLVIIKKILPHLVADQEFIKRFIDEAQVAIKLQHANVAPVFEVGKVDGEYFLAIEYIEGRDLRRMITRQREERTRLPSDLAMFVVREMANGLAYAHRRTDESGRSLALVHCDISPPNVMVSFEGEVKIIDFGIAKSAIRIAETNPNMGFGKFGYMAPEQLVRGGVVDKRTDVYAAGVVLYELLTGERLFTFPEGADYRQIARMVTQGKFKPPSQRDPRLDPGLDSIVMKALASNKEDRYQTAEEFRDGIQVKLSQMNPTINADALAHFMRGLFRDEITEEHALVASMKAVDVAPFQEELDQATH